jgi:hypothetical protein
LHDQHRHRLYLQKLWCHRIWCNPWIYSKITNNNSSQHINEIQIHLFLFLSHWVDLVVVVGMVAGVDHRTAGVTQVQVASFVAESVPRAVAIAADVSNHNISLLNEG